MILWCSYCQKFLGEEPPFENKKFSHGMCRDCAVQGFTWTQKTEEKISQLVELNQKFWNAGISGDDQLMIKLLNSGIELGLRPIDILFGITGPQLVKVGDLWEKNELTLVDEHVFTAACEKIVDLVSQHARSEIKSKQPSLRPEVLLTVAPGNEHTLGLSFVSIGLASIGIQSFILKEEKELSEFIDFVKQENFKILGFSVATEDQMVELKKFIAEFQNRSQFKGRIIIGGGALSKDFSMTDFNSNVVLQPISKFDSSTVSLWHFD